MHEAELLLFLGVVVLGLTTYQIRLGKAWTRFDGWIYRNEEPRSFWWDIAVSYLISAGLIVYSLHRLFT